MQYLAFNTGKVVTPSLITTTINKCLCDQFTTNKTVSNYLKAICNANIVYELDREYILSGDEPTKLSYNKTYYFSKIELFQKFYELAESQLFSKHKSDGLSYHVALGKTVFFHKCKDAGYKIKSGVLSFFSHLENGKTKQNTFSFDFVLQDNESEIYVVFKNDKDFRGPDFTIEAKFALQNIIQKLSIVVVLSSKDFNILESDNIRYTTIDEIFKNEFEI